MPVSVAREINWGISHAFPYVQICSLECVILKQELLFYCSRILISVQKHSSISIQNILMPDITKLDKMLVGFAYMWNTRCATQDYSVYDHVTLVLVRVTTQTHTIFHSHNIIVSFMLLFAFCLVFVSYAQF